MSYILALDQGTSSSRAILFDREARAVSKAQAEFKQFFPQPGWVEHNPEEIWQSQWDVAGRTVRENGIAPSEIAAIGITNQRETTILWDRRTGAPVYNAIVWQDRRTADVCSRLKKSGHEPLFRDRTGLLLDPYFSGTKLKWILDSDPTIRANAEAGHLAFGTVDSWLLWNLTSGRVHATDASNASRTLLYNIHTHGWDSDLLDLLDIPDSVLPEVRPSSGIVGHTSTELAGAEIPIAGFAGDQQAALFGQLCTKPGDTKNTYGTGCFMLTNTGAKPIRSENHLLTTIAWQLADRVTYALEGGVFIGGAVVQWLRDGLGLIQNASDVEAIANSVPDTGGVVLVPAFSGLGAPYWDPYARGMIIGITRGTTSAHIVRAAIESIAYQSAELLECMKKDAVMPVDAFRVDGGASSNESLLQFQADICQTRVERPRILETTALGAAYLAGLGVAFWENTAELAARHKIDRHFDPSITLDEASTRMERWRNAVQRTRDWERH